jgi:hypothetical protein
MADQLQPISWQVGDLRQDSLQKDCTSNDYVIIVMKLAMGKCVEEEKRPQCKRT